MFEVFLLIVGCMISIMFIDSILVDEKSEERLNRLYDGNMNLQERNRRKFENEKNKRKKFQ